MDQSSDNTKTNRNATRTIALAPQDLASLGIGEVAYVKHVEIDGKTAFAVHGANGQPLVVATDRDVAFALTRQNDLEPLSVH